MIFEEFEHYIGWKIDKKVTVGDTLYSQIR